jgi:N-methylhydantoinase B/oxoprolinase/acetone carboxylase alpha subunit
VVAPPGHVLNVDYPGPEVAGNTETHPRLAGIVIGAMAQCMPERAMASESCTDRHEVRPWASVPGGGGYGDPREREPWRIEEDLREGYVSAESAVRDYGHRPSNIEK